MNCSCLHYPIATYYTYCLQWWRKRRTISLLCTVHDAIDWWWWQFLFSSSKLRVAAFERFCLWTDERRFFRNVPKIEYNKITNFSAVRLQTGRKLAKQPLSHPKFILKIDNRKCSSLLKQNNIIMHNCKFIPFMFRLLFICSWQKKNRAAANFDCYFVSIIIFFFFFLLRDANKTFVARNVWSKQNRHGANQECVWIIEQSSGGNECIISRINKLSKM